MECMCIALIRRISQKVCTPSRYPALRQARFASHRPWSMLLKLIVSILMRIDIRKHRASHLPQLGYDKPAKSSYRCRFKSSAVESKRLVCRQGACNRGAGAGCAGQGAPHGGQRPWVDGSQPGGTGPDGTPPAADEGFVPGAIPRSTDVAAGVLELVQDNWGVALLP